MRNNHKRKRIIFVTSIFAISLAALFLVIKNFRENIVFFYSPSELAKTQINKKIIRIGGLVKEGSVNKIDALNTEFVVTDLETEIIVHYQGILPDLFRDKQGVVAKGSIEENGKFFSREILIKHDEKYMPPEVVKSLKEQHDL